MSKLAFVLASCAAAVAAAQPPSPAPAEAPAARDPYRSAFDGYRPFRAQPVAPWQQSNDAVREAGGWRAYAREAQSPASAPAPGDSPPSAPSGYSGHH